VATAAFREAAMSLDALAAAMISSCVDLLPVAAWETDSGRAVVS
jgi:hypothetical protein